MINSFKSEIVRFKKTARTTTLVMIGMAMMVTSFMFIGFEPAGPGGGDAGGGRDFGGADLSTVGGNVEGLAFAATFLGIAALAMWALSIARDYEKGTIRMLLVGQPRRAVLLGGKLANLAAITIVGVAVATIGAVGLSYALAPLNEVDTALWSTTAGWTEVWTTFANLAIATTVWGLIGAVLAMMTRSAATSITAGLAYLMVGESLLGIVWDAASQWLPSGILSAFTSGGTNLVSYSRSTWMLIGYVTASLLALFVVFQRRDITD